MKMYSVYDSKVETYMIPFVSANDDVAIRSFEIACMNPQQTMNSHPADFTLFEIGEFDETTGTITPAVPNRSVINALHLPFWQEQK